MDLDFITILTAHGPSSIEMRVVRSIAAISRVERGTVSAQRAIPKRKDPSDMVIFSLQRANGLNTDFICKSAMTSISSRKFA